MSEHRFAVATAVATFLLLLVGGLGALVRGLIVVQGALGASTWTMWLVSGNRAPAKARTESANAALDADVAGAHA